MPKMPKALDQEWFEKYKEIYSYKRLYFVNKIHR